MLELTNLNFSFCSNVEDKGLSKITQLSSLRCLNIESCIHVKAEGMQQIFQLSNLNQLFLSKCDRISRVGLKGIDTQLPHLTHLALGNVYVPPELYFLTNLTHLDLSNCFKQTTSSKQSPLIF